MASLTDSVAALKARLAEVRLTLALLGSSHPCAGGMTARDVKIPATVCDLSRTTTDLVGLLSKRVACRQDQQAEHALSGFMCAL